MTSWNREKINELPNPLNVSIINELPAIYKIQYPVYIAVYAACERNDKADECEVYYSVV